MNSNSNTNKLFIFMKNPVSFDSHHHLRTKAALGSYYRGGGEGVKN